MSSVGAAIFGRTFKPANTTPQTSISPPVKVNVQQGEKRPRTAGEPAAKSSESMNVDVDSDGWSSSDEDENAKKKQCIKKVTIARAPANSPKNPSVPSVSQIATVNDENLLKHCPVKMRAAINQVLCDYIGSPECKEQFIRALTDANGDYDEMDPNWWQPTKINTVVALLGKMFAKGAAVADTDKPSNSK